MYATLHYSPLREFSGVVDVVSETTWFLLLSRWPHSFRFCLRRHYILGCGSGLCSSHSITRGSGSSSSHDSNSSMTSSSSSGTLACNIHHLPPLRYHLHLTVAEVPPLGSPPPLTVAGLHEASIYLYQMHNSTLPR